KIYKDDNDILTAKIKVLETEEIVVLPYEELVSEYTKYKPGTFRLIKSSIDEYGIEMLKLDVDYYAVQNIKDQYFWLGTD
ncbi:hypothetical protein, partial [Vallitalea maricola]|uniref:hypothetical protein n=1 Tax=Vallitalea maricola TaxID=3074433 RepID=UPI0030DA7B28